VLLFVAGLTMVTRIAAAEDSLVSQEEAALRAAAESVAESVVQIRTIGGLDAVEGTLLADGPTTGLIVSPDGYIISSAFNFVQQPSSILVTLPSGKQAPAELLATDHSRMIVLLKVNGVSDLKVAPIAPANHVKPGQWAVAVGRTFRTDRVNLSVGIISAVNRMFGKAIQTDADVSTACYGGPLVDIRGRVLGVIVPMAPQTTSEVAGAEWYDSGIGFAVPMAAVMDRLESMKKGEDQHPGILGVGMAARNPHSARAVLEAVRPDSPAGKAGFKKGDVIEEIDGKTIRNQTDMRFALGSRYAGEDVRVVAKRGDERLERTVKLAGELPAYRHAFLGVLPMRRHAASTTKADASDDNDPAPKNDANLEKAIQETADGGVIVRMVYAGSPADKAGLRPGDRIVRIDETDVKTIDDATAALNNSAPGVEVNLQFVRQSQKTNAKLEADRMPNNVPSELPPAFLDANDPANRDQPEAGAEAAGAPEAGAQAEKSGETRELKLPEFPNQCSVYVPTTEGPDRTLAALLWLHAPGESNPEAMIAEWKTICDRDGVLLILPTSGDKNRWERTEGEYLGRLMERVVAEYSVDPRRVVVVGRGGGGSMAYLLGLANRDHFHGIATLGAALPRQIKVPPNEPGERVAILSTLPAAKDAAAQIADGLEKLSKAGYPITTVTTAESTAKLIDAQREELARWIDTLDRF
jgi:serine protease Do